MVGVFPPLSAAVEAGNSWLILSLSVRASSVALRGMKRKAASRIRMPSAFASYASDDSLDLRNHGTVVGAPVTPHVALGKTTEIASAITAAGTPVCIIRVRRGMRIGVRRTAL
jgi:hypothetical protein